MVSSLAAKYARALLEVVSEAGREEETAAELAVFRQLLASHDGLAETLENPAIPFSAKRRIVEEVARLLPLSDPVRNFVLVVLENRRIEHFARFVTAYGKVLDEKRGVVRGEVTTAAELDAGLRQKLEETLRRITSRQVRLDYRRDADLIGGMKLQVGSTIFDGTVRTQLEEMKRRLAGE